MKEIIDAISTQLENQKKEEIILENIMNLDDEYAVARILCKVQMKINENMYKRMFNAKQRTDDDAEKASSSSSNDEGSSSSSLSQPGAGSLKMPNSGGFNIPFGPFPMFYPNAAGNSPVTLSEPSSIEDPTKIERED
mmetsp:Transcript_41579/g.47984  ORF Transcript_41579/g.47984 Transcript_41579/m.47984 type:complete len:137 (+) Transcript_41579:495-905(+)